MGQIVEQKEIKIRFASTNDAGMIADLSRKTFYETFAPLNTQENIDKFMRDQFSRERLIKEVEVPGNIFLIAEINNEAVGYTRLIESKNPVELSDIPSIEIARIYSIQKMIGLGVGSELMKRSIQVAHEIGKRVIWLGVWQKNHRAIDFYKRWGFEIFSKHNFILGDDIQEDWLMKKMID